MTVRAGEEIHSSGDFRCRRCGEVVHVDDGLTLPKCPSCGNDSFSWRDRPPFKGM